MNKYIPGTSIEFPHLDVKYIRTKYELGYVKQYENILKSRYYKQNKNLPAKKEQYWGLVVETLVGKETYLHLFKAYRHELSDNVCNEYIDIYSSGYGNTFYSQVKAVQTYGKSFFILDKKYKKLGGNYIATLVEYTITDKQLIIDNIYLLSMAKAMDLCLDYIGNEETYAEVFSNSEDINKSIQQKMLLRKSDLNKFSIFNDNKQIIGDNISINDKIVI